MHLTKRNKSLMAVFVIGLMALAADQTLLRPEDGPQTAAALDSGGSALLSITLPVLQDGPRGPGLAERLDKLWSEEETDFEQIRNPFALPASWSGTACATGETLPEATTRFLRTHRLAAIVRDGERSYILVGDSILVSGQVLDGFTLVSVGDRTAVFTFQGQQAVLELPLQ